MKASHKKCCEGDIECISPRILTEATTNELKAAAAEIIGDNLYLIIAIGQDGRSARFLPYGKDENALSRELSDDGETELLEIFVDIPK